MKSISFRGTFSVLVAATTLLLSFVLSEFTWARFVRPQLEEVPIDRLTENLAQQVKAQPKDLGLRLNLARTHAMAYALKVDTAEVWVGKESQGAWFGYTPAHVPFKAVPTDDPEKLVAARAHLRTAIQIYKEILQLDPKHLTARLGYAWCLDQAGQRMNALDEYRKTIELGWEKEKELTRAGVGWHSVVQEAAGYLIPLLDKQSDREEIARLEERIKVLSKIRRPITPIAIPLRDGLTIDDVQDRAARVSFDADGSGYAKSWSWISRDAAWLVYDHRSTGRINSALQMFGNVTFWLFWEHGYQALASLDNNRDGQLSGSELHGLAIWHDANGNGVSESGEVRSLRTAGITGLSCRCIYKTNGSDQFAYSPEGATLADGSKRPTYDVVLHPRP